MLTSQEQVAAYMSGQLSVDTIGHRPPVPVRQMPWRYQLSEINQQLAPTLVSRQAQDPIMESRSAQTRPSQDEEQTYHTVEVLVTETQQQQQVPDPASVSESTESFYYRDRLLPPGWYVKIGKKQVAENSYEVETSFFSPEGAMLTSQEQVAAYMSGQLSVDTIGHRPPARALEPDAVAGRDQPAVCDQPSSADKPPSPKIRSRWRSR